MTSRLGLGYVSALYLRGSVPLDLHNGGNDARWEVWCLLKSLLQGLGRVGPEYAGMWLHRQRTFVESTLGQGLNL